MRTTITIRDDLHEAARRRAFEERRSLSEVLNELIALGLAGKDSGTTRTLGRFTGQISIPEDFDAPIDSLDRMLDEPVDPARR